MKLVPNYKSFGALTNIWFSYWPEIYEFDSDGINESAFRSDDWSWAEDFFELTPIERSDNAPIN
ncbi:hypothetical protein pVco7_gp006 [Vibrio phage pVco-7]|uniref:Uncharacterized protein n=1 Tax=Vibrio phage pVco-5 TaxID=1965485 RepID=A0A1W6JUW2_9CAUD|nr:hypothetical protein KNT61_gp007 [Vibrio phage pVco-5]ARM70995.1 hypothetical protein pVco5_007 [Vibrio phage pVco-5]